MEFDQEFVEYIVKALVNKPEEVKSDRKVDEQGVLITVHTSPEDTGYVIGKGGKTAVAIRTLLATLGAKGNLRISFRIDAPDNGKRRMPEATGGETAVAEPVGMSAPVADTSPDMDEASVDSLTF
ncbi:MAG: KH domain-containing protein [Patescibacteria group bacterium]